MRYVILRDDDTNALTPVECLERLYRPFLDRGMLVNLAVIPDVATDATTPDGTREEFLFSGNAPEENQYQNVSLSRQGTSGVVHCLEEREKSVAPSTIPIGENGELVSYLRKNPGYRIVQHGCHHNYFEFDCESREEISRRLDRGVQLLIEAGFPRPVTFVAPHDKLSQASYREVAKRFRVISSGWFELRRLPITWWPKYFEKKMYRRPHWHYGRTLLLSHPGCLLSSQRNYDSMLNAIIRSINSRRTTVLVTHWWEYSRDGKADENFIRVLHQTADYLAAQSDIKVISFSDLAQGRCPLN